MSRTIPPRLQCDAGERGARHLPGHDPPADEYPTSAGLDDRQWLAPRYAALTPGSSFSFSAAPCVAMRPFSST